jgi:exonuclease-1
LCDELEEVDGSPKKSKFFSKPQTTKRSTTRSKSEAYLMSDDSIDEALNNLPDIDGWFSSIKPKKIQIFDERKKSESRVANQETLSQTPVQEAVPDIVDLVGSQEIDQLASQDTSQETNQNTSQEMSQETSQSTVMSSESFLKEVSMPPPRQTGYSTKLSVSDTPARPSLRQFAYSARSTTTPASAASSRSSVFSAASTPSTAPSTAQSRLTPLQRLGAKALHPAASPKPLLQQQRKTSIKTHFFAGVPVNPSFVPLPKVDLNEVEALNRSCGSEDQIIPDSDEEVEEAEDRPIKLDLSRFVCS